MTTQIPFGANNAISKRNQQMSQSTANLNHPAVFNDTEIQTMLEKERDNLIKTTNFLEAMCAKLSLTAAGLPSLSVVEENAQDPDYPQLTIEAAGITPVKIPM
jgi:hypothetical protein